MTATADTNQHPDISEISDLTEGLLSPHARRTSATISTAARTAATPTLPWKRFAHCSARCRANNRCPLT
ncbi:hypothetical protein NKH18_25935 [Streptomyces sp. M10(2022)]